MKKDYTEIAVVLDRSGSMSIIAKDICGGFDTMMEEQKKVPGTANVTLAQFDNSYEMVYEGLDLNEIPPLKLVPRGCTALLDAIGLTINSVGERLDKLDESEKPDKVIFIIITDGAENASKEFTRSQVMDLIKHQEDKYGWDIVYLGTNQDAVAVGGAMGFAFDKSMTYDTTESGMRGMFSATAGKMTDSRVTKASFGYDNNDRSSAMGGV